MFKIEGFSKSEIMNVLIKIYLNEDLSSENPFLLFQLLDDDFLILPDEQGFHLTNLGIYELDHWDPILSLSVLDYSLSTPNVMA